MGAYVKLCVKFLELTRRSVSFSPLLLSKGDYDRGFPLLPGSLLIRHFAQARI